MKRPIIRSVKRNIVRNISSGSSGSSVTPSYTQNFVNSQGSASLFRGSLIGSTASSVMTLAASIKLTSLSAFDIVLFVEERMQLFVQSGSISFAVFDNTINRDPLYVGTSSAKLALNTLNYIHIQADFGATPSVIISVNGVAISMVIDVPPTTGVFDVSIAGFGVSSTSLQTNISDLFVDMTQTLDVSNFYDGGPKDISGVGSPIVFFGDTQKAVNWNAGTNLGSGGDFVVASTFVDA